MAHTRIFPFPTLALPNQVIRVEGHTLLSARIRAPRLLFLRFPRTYSTTSSAFCQDFACVLGLVSVHVDLFLAQFRINKLLSGIKAEIARKQEAYKRRDHAEQCAFAAEELYAEQNCRNGAVRHTAEQRRYADGRAERGTQTDKQRQRTAERGTDEQRGARSRRP